jgi:MoxR-like ATPase
LKYPIYPNRGRGTGDLPMPIYLAHSSACDYLPDPGLTDAINISLLLGQPLLVTGEPGTGKTLLAAHLAEDLGLGTPLTFECKSTSDAKDLFYIFDSIGRFHSPEHSDPRGFVTYQALGLAILYANEKKATEPFVAETFSHEGPKRSVVLIDEIDKTPRDFPNDILNQIERLRFQVPEIGTQFIAAASHLRPIVVITSNSERNLPDAFLRRCIYFDIPFPSKERLEEIVLRRISSGVTREHLFLNEALDLFMALRNCLPPLRKRPATSELLGWVEFLSCRIGTFGPKGLRGHKTTLEESFKVLIKLREDDATASEVLTRWLNSKQK